MKQLAIVIPAYKATFLRTALDSIAAQTCQDFTLYIGDDCSPYEVGAIVDEYRSKMSLVYKRFETNMGGNDLVAQWERCIAMSQGEPYIWLFSDDDVMEPRCVELFYDTIKKSHDNYDIYHFDVEIIDNEGGVIQTCQRYPQSLDNYEYYKGKLSGLYASLVVENIFSRYIYERKGGFKKFDLAWGSDTATWIIFSERNGFNTIDGAFVQWRNSDENISPNLSNPIVERKVNALLDFFEWSFDYFKSIGHNCFFINLRAFISRMRSFANYISDEQLHASVKRFCSSHGCKFANVLLYFVIMALKRRA